ncbi:MAG: hypothetical protein GY816_12345 [Cytophagales bacterium]|nr:hypothetical protein [Cytophagales bacterium]
MKYFLIFCAIINRTYNGWGQSGLHSKWVSENEVIYYDRSGTIWIHDIQSNDRQAVLVGSQPAPNPKKQDTYAFRKKINGKSQIAIKTRDNSELILIKGASLDGLNTFHPIWSSDGRKLAFNAEGAIDKTSTLFIYDYLTKTLKPYLQDQYVGAPSFFPNGDVLITLLTDTGSSLVRYDYQSNDLTELMSSEHKIFFSDVSPDGNEIVLTYAESGNLDIWRLNLKTGERQQLTETPYDEYGPRWAPDGSRLTFFAEINGHYPVFVMDISGENMINLNDENR